ncbi:MAG: cytochrome c biogenesis protein CcsA [Cyanobacteria bacterium P01_H01_bin.15]
MNIGKFILGICLGLIILLVPFDQFTTDSLESLKTLTVQLEGRKKPLDTVARETVTEIHGRPTFTDSFGQKLDYFSTYLSLWLNDRDWNEEPFVMVNYRPLKMAVGLPVEKKYFTFQELVTNPQLNDLVSQAQRNQALDQSLTRDEQEALTIADRLALVIQTVGSESLPLVPHPSNPQGKWLGVGNADNYYSEAQVQKLQAEFLILKTLYQQAPSDRTALAEEGAIWHQTLVGLSPNVYPATEVMSRETRFNSLHPFRKAWMLYGVALVVMILALVIAKFQLYWTSLGFFTTGIAIQAYGFWERMQIAGRPPVTNMYESVIWVGFGIAGIALMFELIYRAKYYLLAAAPLAMVCLVLADSLPAVLDSSIKPLVPVLRDNFWLSIHVPTITLSYASFALAMGLGHIIMGWYVVAPESGSKSIAQLSRWNYGVLQVGVLLLAAGIILGGIWAHFSWGRFWGWDPKETWAFIALLSYLVPLHGRLVGWLGNFAMAAASVICFNSVLMAWYGVNFVLGTGLHSYGFGTGGSSFAIAIWVGLDLLLVLAAASRHYQWFAPKTVSQTGISTSEISVSKT